MKNYIYTVLLIIFALIIGINNTDIILTNSRDILTLVFTLLGLSLTAYTFIFTPLQNIINNKNDKKISKILDQLLNNYEDNMKYMFFICIAIVILEFINNTNFIFIKNPLNIDFGIIVIKSLKETIIDSAISFLAMLSFWSFFDIMKATFVIVRGSVNKDNNQ